MLGKLPGPGRPTNSDESRARTYNACSGWDEGCLDIFTRGVVGWCDGAG